MCRLLLFVFTTLFTANCLGQSYLAVDVDNDLYFGTDRYYSSGIFLEYGKRLDTTSIDSLGPIRTEHWTLGQEITTPHLRLTERIEKIDYPYNGWLYLGYAQEHFKNPKKGQGFGLQLGVTGANVSLAKPVQNTYHKIILGLPPLSWLATQAQTVHANLFMTYYRGFSSGRNLDWVFYGKAQVGTFQTTARARFGLQWSTFEGLPFFGNRLEILSEGLALYIGMQGEYRGHDYAVEGSLFKNNAALDVEAVPLKQEWEFGLIYHFKQWRFLTLFNNASKDVKTQRFSRHNYLNITITRLF